MTYYKATVINTGTGKKDRYINQHNIYSSEVNPYK